MMPSAPGATAKRKNRSSDGGGAKKSSSATETGRKRSGKHQEKDELARIFDDEQLSVQGDDQILTKNPSSICGNCCTCCRKDGGNWEPKAKENVFTSDAAAETKVQY